jgi:hypothetical protein
MTKIRYTVTQQHVPAGEGLVLDETDRVITAAIDVAGEFAYFRVLHQEPVTEEPA